MPPLRVVSLCPSITETIVAIGGLKAIAGVTRYCTRPSGMLWGLPRVGGTKSPNIPRILDLKPDLVFANAEENRKEDVEALRAEGIEVDVTLPKTVARGSAGHPAMGAPAGDRRRGERSRGPHRGGDPQARGAAARGHVSLRLLDLEGSRG